jgi:ferritin
MISKRLQDVLNQQMILEFYSSNLYLQISAYFYYMGFCGISKYFKNQAEEERCHGMKIFNFLLCSGADVFVEQIPASLPHDNTLAGNFTGLFEAALEQELKVTASINGIMREANVNEDYAVVSFLQWFVDEQVKETKDAALLVRKVDMIGSDRAAMLALDAEIKEEMEEEISLDDFEL